MDPVTPQRRHGLLFYVGSAGLLLVMVSQAISVVGRHVRIPLLGALEMAQAAIVPAACASMVIASLAGTHAVVHLVTERLPSGLRGPVNRLSCLLAAVFFVGLCVGVTWLARDFWSSHEASDVLHIPFRPLRILVSLAAGALSLIYLVRALRRTETP